jgi:hypothetical protein
VVIFKLSIVLFEEEHHYILYLIEEDNPTWVVPEVLLYFVISKGKTLIDECI